LKNQILKIGIYNGVVLCLLLEYLAIGDFTRSAKLGGTLGYFFWLYFACGILMRSIFLKYLKHYNSLKAFIAGVTELIAWIIVQSYLFMALYFKTKYEINIHFEMNYIYQAILFVFALLILFENIKIRLLTGIASIFLIFQITVGIELITGTSYGDYLMFLNPLPFILITLLFHNELKRNPKSDPEIIDDRITINKTTANN